MVTRPMQGPSLLQACHGLAPTRSDRMCSTYEVAKEQLHRGPVLLQIPTRVARTAPLNASHNLTKNAHTRRSWVLGSGFAVVVLYPSVHPVVVVRPLSVRPCPSRRRWSSVRP